MKRVHSAGADLTAARRARAAVGVLMSSLGAAGLVETRTRPHLLASVDQHAAAVRDSLFGDLRPLTEITLTGYAHGIQDAAVEYGWRPPMGTPAWADADWVLTRLLAVCALLARLGPEPA